MAPAFTVTDMTRAVAENPSARQVFENRVAIGRLAGPDNMAGVGSLLGERCSGST